MSDLTGGGPSAAASNGRVGNNGASKMQQGAPAPTDSPSGRFRVPTEVLRDRRERDARKKAEREAIERAERARAEEEAILLDRDWKRRAEKRAAAAGVAEGRTSGGEDYTMGSAQAPVQRVMENAPKAERASGGNTGNGRAQEAPIQGRGRGGSAMGGGEVVPGAVAAGRVRGPTVSQGQPRPVQNAQNAQNSQGPGASQSAAGPSVPPPPPPQESSGESAGPQNTTRRTTQSSFPHAFERWETLSAHWEGLTAFWVRRLQENANEIERDPVSTQLSRQVTDLSAAGANLFHAVVELQRLRASSERKFQRWFFETRTEQERTQEVQAMLEAALQEERRSKAVAVAEAVAKERERSNAKLLVAEMKREMQISKEEARRAWEELGRREQEERERTISLRQGHPTLVGGLQVLPMMPAGAPSRNASVTNRPQAQEGASAGSPGAARAAPESPVVPYQQTSRAHGTDPFVENSRTSSNPSSSLGRADASSQQTAANSKSGMPQYSRAPAVQPPTTSANFYQQRHGTNLLPAEDQRSEGTYSDTEYDIDPSGQIRRDSRGNKIRYSDPRSDDGSDEMDVAAERERELAHLRQYGHAPSSSEGYVRRTTTSTAGPSSRPDGGYDAPHETVDYSGEGYGADPWSSYPTHHHPTRLSDVVEEDERSRTSPSLVGRRE